MGPYGRQRARRAALSVGAAALAASLLAACGERPPPVGEIGAVRGFLGGVAAEEPRASLTARDALSAGGTAADAVVAGFFTLAVTYPSGAGLGGGGVCVVYDAKTNKAEALEFLPQGPGEVATPTAVRAMALLHARYGRLPWTQLVAPAEASARFGFPASRALAARIAENADRLADDPVLKAAFLRDDLTPKQEGDPIAFPALSTTLSQLRSRGAGDLYGGQAGRALAAAGGPPLETLRAYVPSWRPTQSSRHGNETLHVAPPPSRGGPLTAQLIASLPDQGVGAIRAAFGPMTAAQGAPAGEAGLAAVDREGSAAACTFSMGAPFGLARTAAETGVILAPGNAPQADYSTPLVVANHHVAEAYLAAAGSGGWTGPVEVARVALDLLSGGSTLETALAEAAREAAPGRVHAVWCPEGVRTRPDRCEYRADPRGNGLGASGDI